jgi:glycosyltransferase involved in cell wall biosynthesis
MYPSNNKQNEVIKIIAKSAEKNDLIKIAGYSFFSSFFSSYDIFHVHWPDGVLYPAPRWRVLLKYIAFIGFLFVTRLRRKKIVWTVHNVGAHENKFPILEKALWKIFLNNIDVAMHLCPQSIPLLASKFGNNFKFSQLIVPHPHYGEEYGSLPDRMSSRKKLDIDDHSCVFIFFGMIRRYKGVESLIEAFARIKDRNAKLIIAGEVLGGFSLGGQFEDLVSKDERIRFIPGFLPTHDLIEYVRASDCVVLPYSNILNSGVANAALSLDRPILGPRSGCIIDYHDRLGDRWVRYLDDDLQSSLEAFLTIADECRSDEKKPDLSFADPDEVGRTIAQVYVDLLH